MSRKPLVRISDYRADPDPERGLTCKKCGCRDFRTYRTVRANNFIQRTRTCRHCGEELLTREIPMNPE